MKIKIIILSLISILLIITFNTNIYAGDVWKYLWDNTSITIPVGESFENYKNLPQATLYRNDVALTDAQISYNTEGDWLFYSKNINTSKIGEYKVWYKAYDNKYIPGTCTGYKALISFYVKDLIKPNLTIIKKEINIRRGSEYDLMSNINYSDNYSKELNVEFSENVDFNKIGTYKVDVKITDESQNYTTDSFDVNIYDDSIPTIECMNAGGDINIPLNQEYDIKSLFKASDLYDGDITDKIIFPPIINDHTCDYDYVVSVSNSASNKAEFKARIHVIDDKEPKIILSTKKLIFDYKIDPNNINYLSYVTKIEDNQNIDYSNLVITNNIINSVGNYLITYQYDDGIYKTTESIDVSLISHESPTIEVEDVILNIDSQIDLSKFVTIKDDSDPNIKSTLVIDDSNVIYEKEGTYYANCYCINSSGLSSEKRIKVIINGETKYTDNTKNYSITSIILMAAVGILILINVSYIIINTKNKIKNHNDNHIE